jgi:hypothetical protein
MVRHGWFPAPYRGRVRRSGGIAFVPRIPPVLANRKATPQTMPTRAWRVKRRMPP